MADWKTNLELEPNDKGRTHLQVSLSYTKGGPSFLSGTSSRRGIYAHATPVKVEDGFTSTMVFDGAKRLLHEMTRLNRKTLQAEIAAAKKQIADKDGPVWRLVEHVLAEGGYKLKEVVTV